MINWQNRYAKIISRNKELLNIDKSILEIGCGSNGIATYLKRNVTGIDKNIGGNFNEYLTFMPADVLDLPFSDNSYDFVICVDVLEHIKPALRSIAIKEMIRVVRNRLIISCPCDKLSYECDVNLSKILKKSKKGVPIWLLEHISNGLPELGDIVKILNELNVCFTVTGNEGIMQHYGGLLIDLQFKKMSKIYRAHAEKALFTPPIGASDWDLCYSYLFEINKNDICNKAINDSHVVSDAKYNNDSSALYSVFHKNTDSSFLGKIIPIYAGSVATENNMGHCLTDQLRNLPSLLNTRWSELSAIYKIWKDGPQTNVVGFSHYRRLFNFNKSFVENKTVSLDCLIEKHLKDIYDNNYICSFASGGICVAKPLELKKSVWEHYCIAHNTNDWCWVLSKISRDYPYLMDAALEQFEVKSLYACNMFITNWLNFNDLCSLWFDILTEFELTVPANRSNKYQNRDISFMAERIFDIWIRYKKSKGEIIQELPIFFIQYNSGDESSKLSAPVAKNKNQDVKSFFKNFFCLEK